MLYTIARNVAENDFPKTQFVAETSGKNSEEKEAHKHKGTV